MVKGLFILAAGIALALIIHSKMDNKQRASLDNTVSTSVDTATTAALDGAQKGLVEANKALTDARKDDGKKTAKR